MESSSNQPQEELPVSPITMSQYVNKVRRLWSDMKGAGHDNFDGAMARYLEYGIAGIDRKRKKRYSLDLSEQSLSINWWSSHRFQTIMRKDIDSLLGRDITIPWKDAIELYPLFEAGFPIQKGLHIGPSPYVLNKVSLHMSPSINCLTEECRIFKSIRSLNWSLALPRLFIAQFGSYCLRSMSLANPQQLMRKRKGQSIN